MKNFNDFLNETEKDVLDVNEGIELYNKILSLLPENDETAEELIKDFYEDCRTYAVMRVNERLISGNPKIDFGIDEVMVMILDRIVQKINIIKNYLQSLELDTGVFEILMYEDDEINSRKIGDFACLVFYILCIESA